MLVLFWPTFFWGRCVWVLAGSINNTQVTTALKAEKNKCFLVKLKKKEERYSRVPRLSDTHYSANGTKGKCKQQSEIEMRHLPAVDRFKRYGC